MTKLTVMTIIINGLATCENPGYHSLQPPAPR